MQIDQKRDSEIVNVIAKRKRNKRVPVVVSSDSSGSGDDEKSRSENHVHTFIDPSEMCEIAIEK